MSALAVGVAAAPLACPLLTVRGELPFTDPGMFQALHRGDAQPRRGPWAAGLSHLVGSAGSFPLEPEDALNAIISEQQRPAGKDFRVSFCFGGRSLHGDYCREAGKSGGPRREAVVQAGTASRRAHRACLCAAHWNSPEGANGRFWTRPGCWETAFSRLPVPCLPRENGIPSAVTCFLTPEFICFGFFFENRLC